MEEDRRSRFVETGMGGISFVNSICTKCIHINEDGQTCTAFPEAIPGDILTGEIKHTEPYSGDNGIQFEKNPRL